jgi:hypothetical protein
VSVTDEAGFQAYVVGLLDVASGFSADLSAALGDTSVVVSDVGAFGSPTPAPTHGPTASPVPTPDTWPPTFHPTPRPSRQPLPAPTVAPTLSGFKDLAVKISLNSNKDESPGRAASLEASVESYLAVASSQVSGFALTSKQPNPVVPTFKWKANFLLSTTRTPAEVVALLSDSAFSAQASTDMNAALAVTNVDAPYYVAVLSAAPTPAPSAVKEAKKKSAEEVGLGALGIVLIVLGAVVVLAACVAGVMAYTRGFFGGNFGKFKTEMGDGMGAEMGSSRLSANPVVVDKSDNVDLASVY